MDSVLIKKPNTTETYTEFQINEFLRCADPVDGAQYFLENYFYIQHPVKGRLLYQPFDYQKRLVNTYHNYRFSISLMPRQTGKSTTAAGYLLWYAMFVPDSTILVAAHKYLGSQEIMQRIRYGYESVPDFIRAGVTNYNKGSIDFDNGSRIVSTTTTENTGRGMSISLLYLDEFAFVRPSIAKEFWTSISPTLATGGKCIITSTPNSDEDQFAQIWNQANKNVDDFGNETELGINGFKPFRSYWNEHPDRDEVWAAQQRAQLGDERFDREMNCKFIIFDETLINATTLAELAGIDPLYKEGQVRWYSKPQSNKTYIIALDPSLGTGGDYSAIEVLELPTFRQIAEWQHNKTPIQQQIKVVADICNSLYEYTNDLNNIYYSVENNTIGEAALIAIKEYGEEKIKGIFLSEPKRVGHVRSFRKGFNTTHKSKIAACAKLKNLIETKKLHLASKPLISQFKTFIASGGSFAAKTGEHDDLVMSLLLIIRMAMVIREYDASLDDRFETADDELLLPMPFIMA